MLRVAKLFVFLALVPVAAGCAWLERLKGDRPDTAATQTGEIKSTTAPELVGYLNRQAEHLKTVRYTDVSIDAHVSGKNYTLGNSFLVCAKPRNLLLSGGKIVMDDIVNLGSNDREFWMYSRFPEPTYVYCSHNDFQQGRGQLQFPFDPDWALQALGMAAYDPNAPYKVETDYKNAEHLLTLDTTTPQGVQVRKVTVFSAFEATGARPQVKRHLIQDASGKLIATAEVKEVATVVAGLDPQTREKVYANVPTRVALSWPQQQFRMEMKMRTPKVNERLTDAEMNKLFTKPRMGDVEPINLAEARNLPSARGATPRR
jgi:hypothetical protein